MTQKYYAHSKDGCPPEEWQVLEEHLKEVARVGKIICSRIRVRGMGKACGVVAWCIIISTRERGVHNQ